MFLEGPQSVAQFFKGRGGGVKAESNSRKPIHSLFAFTEYFSRFLKNVSLSEYILK